MGIWREFMKVIFEIPIGRTIIRVTDQMSTTKI